jgi:flagellar biosynthesis protein FliP
MSDGGGFVSLFWLLLILGPVLFAVTTCFAKVTLVLSALRLGISPRGLIPWSIVASLSLLVSLVIMTPTMEAMWPPLQAVWAALAEGGGARGATGVWEVARPLASGVAAPLVEFMVRHTDPEVVTALRGVGDGLVQGPGAIALAFLISELTSGLALGVMVLVPFVAVDLVVSQVLGFVGGGEQLSVHVALPAKVAVFLAAGGWTQLITSLWGGYV